VSLVWLPWEPEEEFVIEPKDPVERITAFSQGKIARSRQPKTRSIFAGS